MSLVVREEGSVPIPEELAEEFGIHKGSQIEWERTADGSLTLRATMSREETIRAIRGAGRKFLKPGESGVESFLRWRQEERELDDTY
ncbi:AbrB/MazE/SpoVT family DNA-binding domain-containing protein [Fimbriimonas ginsengisoli]|uniref:SpoVT-AbrB domain-containing protein n=1 Tax=Fimbriimonas ginsengisoli Gsoil 348 TaxID=661478 RepID=A0A068NPB5_FIMGI|nr:AbrB/MazE/SpoVT family DNA-binding domain-containing protein [Fimbriimonas ginsengisoli]AIE85296.1 hypothetical protein OP10G_1928 [Fimbriimonas ginsengisoli Gsoil 348]